MKYKCSQRARASGRGIGFRNISDLIVRNGLSLSVANETRFFTNSKGQTAESRLHGEEKFERRRKIGSRHRWKSGYESILESFFGIQSIEVELPSTSSPSEERRLSSKMPVELSEIVFVK